jgi:acetate kinase
MKDPFMEVLVVNAGSTSLKLHRVRGAEVEVVNDFVRADAVGHRVVHGGSCFEEPALVDKKVEREIERLTALAPLHNTPALAAIRRAREALPDVPQVAVFDTAFHRTIPPAAETYAVPRRWREEFGIRRFGFHGISVQWAAQQLRVSRLVVCHLGGGCSVTAVLHGRSVDTTMGFSPNEGVPMATRSGSVDPGALVAVLRRSGMGADALDHVLNEESGMRGLAGGDGLELGLERRAEEGDEAARLAVDVYVHRVAGAVAAMAAAARGVDVLVFTAGIGERSSQVRERVCGRLGFLGVGVDPELNAGDGDRDIAVAGSPVRVAVIRAREELVAARAARKLMRRRG